MDGAEAEEGGDEAGYVNADVLDVFQGHLCYVTGEEGDLFYVYSARHRPHHNVVHL